MTVGNTIQGRTLRLSKVTLLYLLQSIPRGMSETENTLYLEQLSLDDPEVGNIKLIGFGESNEMTAKMEAETLKTLHKIGYQGPLLAENNFKTALNEGPKNIEYTKLVAHLTDELRIHYNLDECVNAITGSEDSSSFIMEISSFLKELGCPYPALTHGHVSDRLSTVLDRLYLVQHLSEEIMAARITRETRPEKKIELKLQESMQAADLRKMLQILGFPKPPANITMATLMQKLLPTIKNTVTKADDGLIGHPILNATLSEKQWDVLAALQVELQEHYRIRREMALKRLDCTIQSFQWSNKTKGAEDRFNKIYSEKRKQLSEEPDVNIADLIASRDELAIIEKTSSVALCKNTKSKIKNVRIGQVPDRGGRTDEQAPPPPEMPPWQQRSAGPSGGGGFRGGQRGGGSNYSRGGGQQQQSFGGGGAGGYSQGGRGGYGGDSKAFDSAGSYNRGGSNNYSRGSNDNSRGGNDYSNARGSTDYSRGGSNYSRDSNDYSRSSNSSDYSRGGSSYSQSQPSSNYSQSSRTYNSFDSAGSYGGYSQDYQEPKRAKTYDQFQQNKTTYADQYVQESQHNQQYHSRDNRGGSGRSGGGRSNYSRGGGGSSSYR